MVLRAQRSKGSRTEQRKELNRDVTSAEAFAGPLVSSKAGLAI